MRCQFVLLVSMFLSSGSLLCSQVPVDPKVQQLKDAWYQKAQELAELGERIIKCQNKMDKIQQKLNLLLTTLYSNLDEQKKVSIKNDLDDFGNKIILMLHGNLDINGFLIAELTGNEKNPRMDVNAAKTMGLALVIENALLTKLVKLYEKCLQEFNKVNLELDLLLECPFHGQSKE